MPNISAIDTLRRLLDEPVSSSDIMSFLHPPLRFQNATFDGYDPDPRFPSQAEAADRLKYFLHSRPSPNGFFSWLKLRNRPSDSFEPNSIYLDGGFGVGKTHLLASFYHAYSGRKAYLSFQELMFVVGLQTLEKTFETFSHFEVLMIDEFELDDPANTRIASNLLTKLTDRGVRTIATSNTPPGALGEDKFSVEDFARELHDIAARFETIRIDGEDYRVTHHHNLSGLNGWLAPGTDEWREKESVVLAQSQRALRLQFSELIDLLASAHPMRVRKSIAKFDALILRDLKTIEHPNEALRFVYFIDKAYDHNLKLLVTSETAPRDIFARSVTHGGDVKKYRRTISRLQEMTSW